MNRREIIKHLATIPLVGTVLPNESIIASSINEASQSLSDGQNIYNSLGVDTIINCRGTFTIIGGSIERPWHESRRSAPGAHARGLGGSRHAARVHDSGRRQHS